MAQSLLGLPIAVSAVCVALGFLGARIRFAPFLEYGRSSGAEAHDRETTWDSAEEKVHGAGQSPHMLQ